MDFRTFHLRLALLGLATIALAGCAPGLLADDSDGNGLVQKSEPSYCSTPVTHAGGITITATAEYEYRPIDVIEGLDGDPVSAPIPLAEVDVVTSSGSVVQCSTTDESGGISLTVPAGAGSYVLRVHSRSNTDKLKASVLEDYYENAPYKITKAFSVLASDSTKDIGTLTASARRSVSSKMEGAAFNILAQIHKVNAYLRTHLSEPTFVAPKVSAYWKAGFNPYDYFYDGGSSGLSFYRVGTGELYILGGLSGDVTQSDTDHFDNSVIIHEYGHFLEDVFTRSDSPGGSHGLRGYGDPRLMWSEAWANFLQAAVLYDSDPSWRYYIDTVGFSGDSVEPTNSANAGIAIKIDLTMSGADGKCYGSASTDSCGRVTVSGEGTFKEMSISRFLFKTVLAVVDGGAGIPFSALWRSLTNEDSGGNPAGLGSSQLSFRNVGLFNQFLAGIIAAEQPGLVAGWNAVRSDEKQNADRRDYAEVLILQGQDTCPMKTMSPVGDQLTPDHRSNPLLSNDFYEFDHDGSPKQIRLSYTNRVDTVVAYRNLDLHLYRESHDYNETGDSPDGSIVLSSARAPALDVGFETIDLTGVPAGRYLINVKAYTYGKTNAQLTAGSMTYRLQQLTNSGTTTEDLCPAH